MYSPLESQESQRSCEEGIEKHFRFYLGFIESRTMLKIRKYVTFALLTMFLFVVIFQFTTDYESSPIRAYRVPFRTIPSSTNTTTPLIIVITPTYKRITRLADMTRMANTLMHVSDLHWIVIEDANKTRPPVEAILNRTNLSYTYLAYKTVDGYPRRGWYQRTMALKYVRQNWQRMLGEQHSSGVVYFGDDDNAYDIRLFTQYIRNVRKLGMWAVGLVGGTIVEAPHVENGIVTRFDVKWNKNREFAVDMAGFAVNLDVVLQSNAVFGTSCKRGAGAPETCLLQDMGLTRKDIEPFGVEPQGSKPKEIYVWHTKTNTPSFAQAKKKSKSSPIFLENYGYLVET